MPSKNLAIEYQGKQHYEPIDIFGDEEEFSETQRRDKEKKLKCENQGVNLVYFTYRQDITEEFIRNVLKKYLT